MTDLQQKIDALEEKSTHQERQLQDLSDMVSKQWSLIERLGGQLSKANSRLESLENNNPESAPSMTDEKPPHY